ncbi:hypothetical protein GCM10009000_083930 [Halobacterium noricense]|uniref:Transposase n=1 Tax=Haladaptatus pallidirubidus TaxID=1008152 RepID=A0AAV3UR06_9EURY
MARITLLKKIHSSPLSPSEMFHAAHTQTVTQSYAYLRPMERLQPNIEGFTTYLAFKSRITLRREELFEFAYEAHWW